MSEKFKKLKTKYLLGAILKSVVCGLSVGLFAVGVVLLVLKLSAISLDIVWYVIIGSGAAVITCVLAFIFFRPTDKKVAARLDNEFGLDERVQTSLEYKGQEGTILEMQRDDTEEKLKTLPKSKIRFSQVWQFCLIAVISIAIAVAAFFIPAKQAVGETPTIDPGQLPAVVTEDQVEAVRGVINNVNGSDLSDDIKTATTAELQTLLDTVTAIFNKEKSISSADLNNVVLATICNVEPIINNSLNYTLFATVIREKGEPNIARAILAGGKSYGTYEIKEYGHVTTFHGMEEEATASRLNGVDTMRKALSIKLEDGLADTFKAVAAAFVNAMRLDNFTEVGIDGDNSTYICINNFAVELNRTANTLSAEDADMKDDDIQQSLNNSFKTFKSLLASELAPQSYAGAMRKYIRNKLSIVFGLLGEIEGQDDPDSDSEGSEGGKNDDPGLGDGGLGEGESRFGSDDLIYDPFTGTYVKYGDILDHYNAILQELINDGTLTEEQANMAKEYFQYLYGTKKDDKK